MLCRVTAEKGHLPLRCGHRGVPGRGAYLCPAQACLEKAWKKRALERVLRLQCRLQPEVKDELLVFLEKAAHR